jgi:hypothetical protein
MHFNKQRKKLQYSNDNILHWKNSTREANNLIIRPGNFTTIFTNSKKVESPCNCQRPKLIDSWEIKDCKTESNFNPIRPWFDWPSFPSSAWSPAWTITFVKDEQWDNSIYLFIISLIRPRNWEAQISKRECWGRAKFSKQRIREVKVNFGEIKRCSLIARKSTQSGCCCKYSLRNCFHSWEELQSAGLSSTNYLGWNDFGNGARTRERCSRNIVVENLHSIPCRNQWENLELL